MVACSNRAQQEHGEPATSEAAQRSQEQAFRERLPSQPCARRSQSGAHRQFSHAAGCPREEQVRDVGTRHKQNSQDSAEQDPGSDAGILDLSVAERTHAERYLVTKLGRNVIEGLLEEWFHRRRRLLNGDAGLEPRKGPQNHLPRIGPAIRGAIESGRNKNVFVAEVGHFELRRKDTHDDRGPTVEGDGTPGKIAVTGEAGTPQPIGDERDTRGLRPVFVAREIAAEERLDAEGWQECGFDERALQTDRVPLGEIAIGSARDKRGYGRKRSLRFLPVHVIRAEHEFIRFEGRFIAKADQAFVVGVGQAAEEDPIDHAEDRRGGSDS